MKVVYYIVFLFITVEASKPPNIVFIVADDLGWNDVGFHGLNNIPTPNIDALAYSGVILNNYYVQPLCTPSRTAIMTGKYPIHLGMQHDVLSNEEARGLTLTEKLLPQYLKDLGYSTHAIGKWHLGFYKKEYTPTYRGFDSHMGFWGGNIDYFDHTQLSGIWGIDMRRNMDPAYDLHGVYCTDLFTAEAESIIENHNKSTPLFMYLAHGAVHIGNYYDYLPAPDNLVAQFTNITDYKRRKFAAMLTKLDESVGRVTRSLQEKGILNETIIIFSTDNGGPAGKFEGSSNWPLRGRKYSVWEGGVRGSAWVWTSTIKPHVSYDKIHVSDWFPTIFSALNYKSNITDIDGVDAWKTITEGNPSKREDILLNIDDITKTYGLIVGDWKILKGETEASMDGHYGPSGRRPDEYDTDLVKHSFAGQSLNKIGKFPSDQLIKRQRKQAIIKCEKPKKFNICKPAEKPCLFNILVDPCEYNNLADQYPAILTVLKEHIMIYNKTVVPSTNKFDPRSDPRYWNYTWTNFGDYPSPL